MQHLVRTAARRLPGRARGRALAALMATTFLAAATAAGPAGAQTAPWPADWSSAVYTVQGSKSLSVQPFRRPDGTLVQRTFWENRNPTLPRQQWRFVQPDPAANSYFIQNVQNGQCLDGLWGVRDGGVYGLARCNPGDRGQQWRTVAGGCTPFVGDPGVCRFLAPADEFGSTAALILVRLPDVR
jgi:hypothetical protein